VLTLTIEPLKGIVPVEVAIHDYGNISLFRSDKFRAEGAFDG
jgi:hypothetical protein